MLPPPTIDRISRRTTIACMVSALLLLATAARAADCPELAGDATPERRALAKEWFSRAEAAETARDDAAATRAYACSFAIVPHPSTAFNLARAAERAGDLRLALTAHREYLSLMPDATDRAEVEARMTSLRSRLAATTVLTPGPAAATLATGASPPPAPPLLRLGTPEWVIAGVGAAALVAGLVLNMGARGAIGDCRDLAHTNNIVAARQSCDRADLFAYTSYALMGTAALAAIVDTGLVWRRSRAREAVALTPLPGGLALTAQGRF